MGSDMGAMQARRDREGSRNMRDGQILVLFLILLAFVALVYQPRKRGGHGRNVGPSQITERPPAPAPMISPQMSAARAAEEAGRINASEGRAPDKFKISADDLVPEEIGRLRDHQMMARGGRLEVISARELADIERDAAIEWAG